MEWKVSSYIRKWLGVSRSLSNIAFYGHNTKLQLPLSSLIEELKVTKARLYMMHRDSEGQVIRDTLLGVKTGAKLSARLKQWKAVCSIKTLLVLLRVEELV